MKARKDLLNKFNESELSQELMSSIRGGDSPPPPQDPGGDPQGK